MMIQAVVRTVEKIVWWRVKKKIAQLKRGGLKVVAIAGSYGKTSVKHYAYELLRHKYRVVATPESFNTILGIAKCLEWEVDESTQIFLVEVGAYHIGDITYLLQMVQPDIGVLTGMARQHLERFGSWENIQLAKSEIAVFMGSSGGQLVANGSDKVVKENVEKLGVKTIWYPTSPLASLGASRNEVNLDGAKMIAREFGVTSFSTKIRQVKNRFEMTTERYGMRVIDDSFSSNDKGFVLAVEHLGKQTKYTRILVTPGLVELGSESNKIHRELGQAIIGNADMVLLVGDSERTRSLEEGIAKKVRILHIEKTLDFIKVVKNLKLKKEPLVLIENDVTENYLA
jgi:UDP-N-acetylmuramoyl-tripeptide--D-alanyl-D-alanine ligase